MDREKHVATFMQEMGFTYAQASGQEDIPVPQVVDLPYEYGKPFVTEDEEINLGTQRHRFHRWYLRMLKENDPKQMFEVMYRDRDFTGEDDFWVNFEDVHAIYRGHALDLSLITIWIL
jgi:hypothetical protein